MNFLSNNIYRFSHITCPPQLTPYSRVRGLWLSAGAYDLHPTIASHSVNHRLLADDTAPISGMNGFTKEFKACTNDMRT